MIKIFNQNILGLVLSSFNTREVQRMFEKAIDNKTLFEVTLKSINYENLFKSFGQSKIEFEGHSDNINNLALIPNGHIISTSDDTTLKIWKVSTSQCIKILEGHKCPVNSLLIQSNKTIISLSTQGELKCWDVQDDFKCIKTLYLNNEYSLIYNLTCLVNGNLACSKYVLKNENYFDYLVVIFDMSHDYKPMREFKAHYNWISAIISLSDSIFATSSYDETVKIWDINKDKDYKCIKVLNYEQDVRGKHDVEALLYCKKRRLLLSAYRNNNIKAWSIDNNYQCIKTIKCQKSVIKGLLSLPCGFFAVNTSNSITIFSLDDFECINTMECQDDENAGLVLLQDYRIASFNKNKILLWGY
jgi:WD40 repeat protein